jgi:hypothetical protein
MIRFITAGRMNAAFLAWLTPEARAEVLRSMAEHYGITPEKAREELEHEEAEPIVEYMTGGTRKAVSVLMQMWVEAPGRPLLSRAGVRLADEREDGR